MFRHVPSCSEQTWRVTWTSMEHEKTWLIMFRTWLYMFTHVPTLFSHVHSCSKKNSFATLKWCIVGFEHPTIRIDEDSANHFTQGRFCKFQSGKGTLSVNRLMLNFRLRTWSDATPLKEALSIHGKHTAYVSGALEKKCYVTYVPFMHAKDTL